MSKRQQLNAFLSAEEQRAFKMLRFSIGNDDDALDVAQEAMLSFVSHYAEKPDTEWKPLFYKVVYSKLNDFHRKRSFRSSIVRLFKHDENGHDEVDTVHCSMPSPEAELQFGSSLETLQRALEALPMRQQQAVLLRMWHGFDTQETAKIMQLSTGSVKTHYSRGLTKLKAELGEDWP